MITYLWQSGLEDGRRVLILFTKDKVCIWFWYRLMQRTIPLKFSNLFIMN
jgi:hypothetical protein